MRFFSFIVLLLAAVVRADEPALDDGFIGVWSMNVSASKYDNDPPQAMRIVMEPAADGIRYRSETTLANGRVTSTEYTANYDGTPAMVTTAHGMSAPVKLRRIDLTTIEATFVRGWQIVATSRRVLSQDQCVMTITTTEYDERHRATTNVGVYRRIDKCATSAKAR